jgi:hypothetical protein
VTLGAKQVLEWRQRLALRAAGRNEP